MNPRDLPIYELESDLVTRRRDQRRLIIQAPTGSGKSTQVPQMLLEHGLLGHGQVVILQPRRLAARLLAARVAAERRGRLGDEVGYQIRFDDVTSPRTRIRFVTEGILLRQILQRPDLPGISAVIFDEFHERHLYSDLTLACALESQAQRRPDLRLLVMSATLTVAPLRRYLDPCDVLSAAGRSFPVSIDYLDKTPPESEPAWETTRRVFDRLAGDGEGDVLIFMPGSYEIHRTVQALQSSPAGRNCVILPLHGELPAKDQDAALMTYDRRKVIVATNVAETSLTIDGIRWVIDSGLARVARFDPYRGINTLLIEKISQSSADQRAGRAGRTAAGRCVRLWTARDQAGRAAQDVPEIRRVDLAETILLLKAGGLEIAACRWLEAPEPRVVQRADQLLKDLDALDFHTGAITDLGRRMAAFPLHPRYSRMLLAAAERNCVREVALIAAFTQGRDILIRRTDSDTRADRLTRLGEEVPSDFYLLMKAWQYADQCRYDLEACRRLGIHAGAARQIGPIRDYFLRLASRSGLAVNAAPAAPTGVRRCILVGFVDQLARRCDGGTLRCLLVHGRKGLLARNSVVRKTPLFVAAEIREVEDQHGELNVLLSLATAVDEAWLKELFPAECAEREETLYDATRKRVITQVQHLFRDLVLETRQRDQAPLDRAAELLADEILAGRIRLTQWDDAVEQWITRVNCLSGWCPELAIPSIGLDDRRHLVLQICHGALSAREVKDRPVWPVLKVWLAPAQAPLIDRYAPERIELPGGRSVKVKYNPDSPPMVAVKIQDLYGVKTGFTVAQGRVPVVIQVLAPNFRPVQVTQDLSGFWRDAYPAIKKELQRKYPKHEWR